MELAQPQQARLIEVFVSIIKYVVMGVLALTSFFLIALILLHKGSGGGMSDMFGGGFQAARGSSGVAERNLNRFTIAVGLLWTAAIVVLQLFSRFDWA